MDFAFVLSVYAFLNVLLNAYIRSEKRYLLHVGYIYIYFSFYKLYITLVLKSEFCFFFSLWMAIFAQEVKYSLYLLKRLLVL